MTKKFINAKRHAQIKRLRNPTIQTLLGAYYILSSSKRWTKATYARDAVGRSTNIFDSDAVCFCASGALMRAKEELKLGTAAYASNEALSRNCDSCVSYFNDVPERKFKDVKLAFAQAIKRESRGRIVLKEVSA